MALKAFIEQTFEADVKFADDSVKKVKFRLPRTTDIYKSSDGNQLLDNLYTIANMAKPFEKPVQVEIEDGSILNIYTVKELIELGVDMDLSDAIEKWAEKNKKVKAEKERLVKKS